jgi:hypothetical protein
LSLAGFDTARGTIFNFVRVSIIENLAAAGFNSVGQCGQVLQWMKLRLTGKTQARACIELLQRRARDSFHLS